MDHLDTAVGEPDNEDWEQGPVEYVYFVYGFVSAFMPYMALRRDKHYKISGQKIVKCPHCREAFTTVGRYERVELFKHPMNAKVQYSTSMLCGSCHKSVGIIYALSR